MIVDTTKSTMEYELEGRRLLKSPVDTARLLCYAHNAHQKSLYRALLKWSKELEAALMENISEGEIKVKVEIVPDVVHECTWRLD